MTPESESDAESEEEESESEEEEPEKTEKKEQTEEKEEKPDEKEETTKTLDFENLFEGTIIGGLANEIAKEINPNDISDIKNPSDIFKVLFATNANGENKLQNIMTSVGQKMGEKIKSGEINQEQLLSETLSAAGKMSNQMGGFSELFQQISSAGGGASGGMPDLSTIMNMMNTMGGGEANGKTKKKNKKRHNKKHK